MTRTETRIFLDSAPIKTRLDFGVNHRVRLKSIDNLERKNKDGIKMARNCNMVFAKYDEDKEKQIAESSFDYFNTSAERPEYAIENIIQQITQLETISFAVIPAEEMSEEEISDYYNELLVEFEALFDVKKPNKKQIAKLLELQLSLGTAAETLLTKYTKEHGDWVDILIVTNRDGDYEQLPRESSGFIDKEENNRKFTIPMKYMNFKANINKKKKGAADDIGDDIALEDESLDDLDDTLEDI